MALRRLFLVSMMAMTTQLMTHSVWATTAQEDVKNYPNRPVTLVVGFATGGPTDTMTRLLADLLSKYFKQTFIVENRLGANGTVAAQYVKAAKPDGYTLFLAGSGTMVVAPNMNPNVSYSTLKDFIPIARVSDYPYFLVVPANSPIKNTKMLIDKGRNSGSKLSYASAGIGAGNHLAGEWFKVATGIDAVHVPYKGDAAAMMDVLAGRLDFAFLSGVTIEPHVKGGKLNVLGVTSLRAGRGDPSVPMVADSGIKDFAVEPWTGIFGPAGMSEGLVKKISSAINLVMSQPDAKERLAALGQFPFPGTPEEFREYIQKENARWNNVIEDAKIPKTN